VNLHYTIHQSKHRSIDQPLCTGTIIKGSLPDGGIGEAWRELKAVGWPTLDVDGLLAAVLLAQQTSTLQKQRYGTVCLWRQVTWPYRQCCGSRMFIPDPESEFSNPRSRVKKIPDPGSTSNNLRIFNPKIFSKLSEIWSGIKSEKQDPNPDPHQLDVDSLLVATVPTIP
jgi:hypothetical protein